MKTMQTNKRFLLAMSRDTHSVLAFNVSSNYNLSSKYLIIMHNRWWGDTPIIYYGVTLSPI